MVAISRMMPTNNSVWGSEKKKSSIGIEMVDVPNPEIALNPDAIIINKLINNASITISSPG